MRRNDPVQVPLCLGKQGLFCFSSCKGFYAEPDKLLSFENGETQALGAGGDCEDPWRAGW